MHVLSYDSPPCYHTNQSINLFIIPIITDDIFIIWSGTESQLVEFHELVNTSSDALTFKGCPARSNTFLRCQCDSYGS